MRKSAVLLFEPQNGRSLKNISGRKTRWAILFPGKNREGERNGGVPVVSSEHDPPSKSILFFQ